MNIYEKKTSKREIPSCNKNCSAAEIQTKSSVIKTTKLAATLCTYALPLGLSCEQNPSFQLYLQNIKYKINSKTSSRIRKTLEEHLHSSQPFLIDVVKNSIRKTTNTSKIEIYWIKSSYKNSNSKFY